MYPSWKSLVKKSSFHRSTSNMSDFKETNGYKYGIRGHLYDVYHEMHEKRTHTRMSNASEAASNAKTVTGKYIQHASRPSQKVIFWIYGGGESNWFFCTQHANIFDLLTVAFPAYLAGDSEGNLGIAEKMGMMCGDDPTTEGEMRDIFIPDYRLVPEYHLDDAIHDITLAYEWLVCERGIRPENVVLLGISSGGGLAVLLMQALAESCRRAKKIETTASVCDLMPAGAVLVGPFVDYTEPKGSMKEYIKHDLIVNQVCSSKDNSICIMELQLIVPFSHSSLFLKKAFHSLNSYLDHIKIVLEHHLYMVTSKILRQFVSV